MRHFAFVKALRNAAAGAALCVGGPVAMGQPVSVSFQGPTLDRWVYPFNTAPGYRDAASVFGSIGQENSFPPLSFDQRDAQLLVGFDLRLQVPTGMGVCGYEVTSAVLTLTTATDGAFRYDPTYDAYTTYPAGDSDTGRPVEVYGAAYRGGWQSCDVDAVPANNAFPCYFEGTQTLAAPPFGPSISADVRHVYPSDFAGGVARDVSNNVRDGFDPVPFAIGQIGGLAVGATVAVDTDMRFALNVADPAVQRYLREAANSGRLRLLVTSLQSAATGGGGGPGTGSFAAFYCKEIGIEGFAARLEMTVELVDGAGDADSNGSVNFDDITTVLANFGNSGAAGALGDADCNGVVNFDDLTAVLANFGS